MLPQYGEYLLQYGRERGRKAVNPAAKREDKKRKKKKNKAPKSLGQRLGAWGLTSKAKHIRQFYQSERLEAPNYASGSSDDGDASEVVRPALDFNTVFSSL